MKKLLLICITLISAFDDLYSKEFDFPRLISSGVLKDEEFDRNGNYSYKKVGEVEFIEITGNLSNKAVVICAKYNNGILLHLSVEDRFFLWDKKNEKLNPSAFGKISVNQLWYMNNGDPEIAVFDSNIKSEKEINECIASMRRMQNYLNKVRSDIIR